MKSIYKIFSIILCVAMILSVACYAVCAKTIYTVGDWVYEKINDNKEFQIVAYNGTYPTTSTPYYHNNLPITTVATHAFLDNTTLTKVTLSPVLYCISEQAFLNASALEEVVISGDVTEIGGYAFSGCTSLTSINLEDTSINSVDMYTFSGCSSLTEVTVPDSVTEIEEYAFADCDSLSKITIPASVTYIHPYAFNGSENTVIYCYKDSFAHRFAANHMIDYVLLDDVEMFILGDTDGDGDVTILDAAFVQLIVAQKKQDTDGRMSIRGDIDRDGLLSVMDATEIQFYLADTNPNENIGKEFPY
ncbi:MAG: leucine-rich repeat protein [Eubacteriales bacterium]|nr:leucine-rich repeat protein [Eubacteriales bacterium]